MKPVEIAILQVLNNFQEEKHSELLRTFGPAGALLSDTIIEVLKLYDVSDDSKLEENVSS